MSVNLGAVSKGTIVNKDSEIDEPASLHM